MVDQAVVGPASTSSVPVNSVTNLRAGQLGELITQDAHGRFYEANYRGNMYMFGGQDTVLASVNATATGLTQTAKPIIGVYNPSTSPVNLIILQATVLISTIANSAVNTTGFYWVGSTGNAAVSTGTLGTNCKTQQASGGNGKGFHVSTALTGLTNSLVVIRPAAISALNAAGAATAVTLMQGSPTENVDGGLMCIPGGVLGIMNEVSITTLDVSASIVWEEVPV